MPGTVEQKVVAYVRRGESILVFVHVDDAEPLWESGLQVPSGTLRRGEKATDGAVREAAEETGLTDLRVVWVLGADEVHWPGRPTQRRHFVQLATDDERDEWEHLAPDEGGVARRFRCSWLPIEQAPLLAAAQGVFAAALVDDP
ncbi:MAG: NUDIX domain-containing protein [Aquihabitans sp.]